MLMSAGYPARQDQGNEAMVDIDITAAPAHSASPEVTRLWYTRCPVPTASGLALDLGWLDKQFGKLGIALSSIRDSDDAAIRLAHYDHRLPGLFREGGNIPAIWAKSEGHDTAVVALTWVDEYQAVLVRPDSPIQKLSDLASRRLGLPRQRGQRVDFARAMALRGLDTALRLGGLTQGDVIFVDIDGEQTSLRKESVNGRFHNAEAAALVAGHVDAIYVKGAVGRGVTRENGLRVLVDIAELADPLARVNNGNPRPVTVDRRTALERPDLVARYLSVLIRAAAWARTDTDRVVEIVSHEVGRTPDDVRAGYGPNLSTSFGLDLSPLRRRGLASQKDFLLASGFIRNDFDVGDWINPAPLAEALENAGS
jgi:ABC-type nitrate/sulfonate/bicarbonate transport system substrate-binding protein